MKKLSLLFACALIWGCVNSYSVSGISTERYMSNHRLMITTDAPDVSVRKEAGNFLAVVLPPNTRLSVAASEGLKNLTEPCSYEGIKQGENNMMLLFTCADGIKVYPEVYRGKLDIIFSDGANK